MVCENFRPGTLERWSIGPADLDPRLVTVRVSVFGQDGPNSPRGGLDRMGIAYGGLLHLTGYPDRPPVRPGINVSDYLTGVFASQAAVAALYERDARGTGTGAVIDACLYGSILRILEWTIAGYDQLGVVRGRSGNRLPDSAPLDNYETADGRAVCIAAASDANFARLCAAMDRDDLPADPRFDTIAKRAERGDEINQIVADWAHALDAAEVERRCLDHDVPVATAYSVQEIVVDEHMVARGDVVEVVDPDIGVVRQQAPYPRFVGESRPVPTGAPRLGEHNHEVYSGVGLSDHEIEGLVADGVI